MPGFRRGRGKGQGWKFGACPAWLRDPFVGAGYKMTVPRRLILAALASTDQHLSAEEIHTAVRGYNPHIGLNTVYRTLDVLTRLGIVDKFDFGEGKSRYELAMNPKKKHHHHLVCKQCGRVIDYTDFVDKEVGTIHEIEKALAKKYRFTIEEHRLAFYGLCEKCK